MPLVATILLALTGPMGMAQSASSPADSTRTEIKLKKGSIFSGRPGKALLLSLAVPGAGQIYNKSYLRVPFVWAAVGGMGYWVHDRTIRYKCLDAAYRAAVDGEPFVPTKNCPADLQADLQLITDAGRLRIIRDKYNENRQLAIVGFTLVWLANGIDAFVNAHLKTFNVTDDLSLAPVVRAGQDPFAPVQYGLRLSF